MNNFADLIALQQETSLWFRIVIILGGSYILNYTIHRLFNKIFKKASTPKTRTVLQLLQNAASVIIFIIALLTLLAAIGINIMPLLASAGIVGFAVGFGSQSLIKDIISGIFILTGDVFYEGDTIKIGDVEGRVEKVGIRAVTLRDINGVVVTIPNGSIGVISNLTKDWSRANVDIGVPAEYPIDKVLTVFRETVDELRNDDQFSSWILGIPKVEGINSMDGAKVIIKTLLKTHQSKKWQLEREFRYRLKKKFEQENMKFA